MKKNYVQPTTIIVKLESKSHLLFTSVNSVGTNMIGDDAINYGGGSNQAAYVKSNTIDWDDLE